MEVCEIVHLDIEMEGLEAAVAVDQLKIDDVGVLGAKYAGHRPERAGDVAQYDREPGGAPVRTFPPRKVEPVGIHSARQRVAANDVDLNLLVLAAKADDAVAGDRVAALGEVVSDAGRQALDGDGL